MFLNIFLQTPPVAVRDVAFSLTDAVPGSDYSEHITKPLWVISNKHTGEGKQKHTSQRQEWYQTLCTQLSDTNLFPACTTESERDSEHHYKSAVMQHSPHTVCSLYVWIIMHRKKKRQMHTQYGKLQSDLSLFCVWNRKYLLTLHRQKF